MKIELNTLLMVLASLKTWHEADIENRKINGIQYVDSLNSMTALENQIRRLNIEVEVEA